MTWFARFQPLHHTILLLTIALTACNTAPTPPTRELAELAPPLKEPATSKATPAANPSAAPSATHTVSPAAPTCTQTATPDTLVELSEPWPTAATPSRTPTTTPASTLAPAQEGDALATLMATNGGCALPCWWGVTPGVTGAQAARDLFAAQGIDDWVLSNASPPYATMALGYPRPDNASFFRDVAVTFWLDDGQVYFIGVDGSLPDDVLRPIAIELWAPYGPAALLNQYGQPIFIELAPINNSTYYRLIFAYDTIGVEIVYVLPFALQADGQARVCLELESVDYIALALYQPDQASQAPIGLLRNRPDTHTSWESATGLSRADLAELLLDNTSAPCLNLP
ncbi:MAG: hypothetical protein H6651_06565 [Ardenticatenales bacterium]|nr:hypothetical protein [Ardenticatenales bacterium]